MNNSISKSVSFLTIFLLIITLTSKEILIFNEEIIIAFCFFLFVYVLTTSLGETIATELNERASKIRNEIESFYNVRTDTIINLINFHKMRKSLTNEIETLINFVENILKIVINKRQISLQHAINVQINSKLANIKLNELQTMQETKNLIVNIFEKKLIERSQKEGTPWRDSLTLLKTLTLAENNVNTAATSKKRSKKRK